jgi:hypothetical protein
MVPLFVRPRRKMTLLTRQISCKSAILSFSAMINPSSANDRINVLSKQLSMAPASAIIPGQDERSFCVTLPEKLTADGEWRVRR